jgi:hypothetical protein
VGHSEDLDSARVGKSHAHTGLAHEPSWNRPAEWLRFPLMFGRVWPCRASLTNTNLALPASLPLALVLLRQIRRFLVVRRATDDIRQGKAHLCRLVQLMFQPPLRPAAAEAQSDSIRHFVAERIQAAKGSDLATNEIVSAYFEYCDEKRPPAPSCKAKGSVLEANCA